MGVLRDLAFATIGYGVARITQDDNVKHYDNLEDLIAEYAHSHDIWGRNQDFYKRLMQIAEEYKDPYAFE